MVLFVTRKENNPDVLLQIVEIILSHTDGSFTSIQKFDCASGRRPTSLLNQNLKAFIATENFLKLAPEL